MTANVKATLFVILARIRVPLKVVPGASVRPHTTILTFLTTIFKPIIKKVVNLLKRTLKSTLFCNNM